LSFFCVRRTCRARAVHRGDVTSNLCGRLHRHRSMASRFQRPGRDKYKSLSASSRRVASWSEVTYFGPRAKVFNMRTRTKEKWKLFRPRVSRREQWPHTEITLRRGKHRTSGDILHHRRSMFVAIWETARSRNLNRMVKLLVVAGAGSGRGSYHMACRLDPRVASRRRWRVLCPWPAES